ncbi:acetyl-CoA C-acetyltransferase [Paraburkholderia sp. Se-20369]|nr:acetyl-CoA C-acetyltransferase [Paraburkholderia sp. Se-20369]
MANSYIVGAARTPRGKGKIGKGALTGVHPQELLASVLRELPKRSDFDVRDVDDAVVGAVSQIGAQGANIARNAVLAAGWPQEIGGVSLNRFCGSGLQAINFAAMGVASGAQQLVVAGGVESMSQFGLGADGGGQDAGNIKLRERVFQVPQGISADLIATLEGFSREDVDAWALRSQENAAVAINDGRFNRSLVPVSDPFTGELLLTRDEFPRPDTTAQGLAALQPSFEALGRLAAGPNGETLDQIAVAAYPQAGTIRHVHTAGNSSGIVDGAAAVAIASEDYVKAHGLKPLARIRAVATVGSEPLIMLTAPALASRKALRMAGMHPNDIDLWEINEAFAAVVLQAIRQLEIDPARVNVNGGSIALGHPLGATGAILIGTALDELERRGKSTALISMCIGGGQGIATLIERV